MSRFPLSKTMSEIEYRDVGLLDALDDEQYNARQRRKTSDEEYADRLQALADEDTALAASAINCK
jgi:hypothetical protein